jgi:hypothetical protein
MLEKIILAVILIVAVLGVVYYGQDITPVLGGACSNNAKISIETSLKEFRMGIEAAMNGSEYEFNFAPDKECFKSKDSSLKIEYITNMSLCGALCDNPEDECRMLIYTNPTGFPYNQVSTFCINKSKYMGFAFDKASCGNIPQGFVPINPAKEDLNSGKYLIRNMSLPQNSPRICILYKAD